MRIALVQQHATLDLEDNLRRGLEALTAAGGDGAQLVCFAELAFEPFYPQRPAGDRPAELAQEVPGPSPRRFRSAPPNSASWSCSTSTNGTAIAATTARR